jgi:hypothetical protein
MSRANPNSLATKWVEQSDAMSDELHALEDAVTAARKARDKWLHDHPATRRRLERLRDSAPIYRDNKPFSIFKS